MSTKGRQTMEGERVAFNLAKLKRGGLNFEIAIDPDLAIDFRNKKPIDIREVIKSESIFHDVKKGLHAQESKMKELFSTTDMLKVAEILIKEGEIQLTEEYREKKREEKRKSVIYLISRNCLDPTTKLPHPPKRIESAMEQAKVKIDEFKTAEAQIDDIIKKLRPIIPISMDKKKLMLKFPPEYAAKAYSMLAGFAKPEKEEWANDGSFICTIEIPAGIEADLYERINRMTKGSVEVKVL